MRRSVNAIVILLVVAACGGDPAGPVVADTTTLTTTPATTGTTDAPATTATTASPPSEATAADALATFFAAANALDEQIRDTADLFNSEWDPNTATVGTATVAAIASLDATSLDSLIPPGLSPDLEVAVLAVYADLDSRIAALDGGARYPGDGEYALTCLGLGGESADRFDDDLATAISLAGAEPPPSAAANSPAAGVLAVRLSAIHGMNWGCDSCGGTTYTEAFPVDWEGQTLLGGVDFEGTFNGASWEILIYAC